MYTKISHNIVEEHYGEVMGAGTQSVNPHANPMIKKKPTSGYLIVHDGSLSIHDELPQYVLNEDTMLFRMDARTAWTKWAWSLINYSIALNANLSTTPQVLARLSKNAVALGDFIVPYYGPTAGTLLADSLIAIGNVGVEYVNAVKAGSDTTAIEAKWVPLITDLAKTLNGLNPENWPETLLVDIFTNVVNAWKNQLAAQATNDTVASEIAVDYINKLVATGVKDHVSNGYASLADVFSRGIIAQYPSMFQG